MKDFSTSLKTQSCGFLPRVGCVVAEVLEAQMTMQDHAVRFTYAQQFMILRFMSLDPLLILYECEKGKKHL